MRVVRLAELPIVIKVRTPQGVIVALPRTGCLEDVLTLASLVLSSEEFTELQQTAALQETAGAEGTSRAEGTGGADETAGPREPTPR